MANITIKELLAADKISEIVDKINFNFDQLLLNGGGPIGLKGGPGEIGPIGPRGTLWFTAADLYTTSASPSWSGSTERINDITASNYPQFGGDPNRYLPVGLGPNPENTFTMGNINKLLRDGDLYIQEGDDVFQTYSSTDGDIWEYDGFTFTWVFTGVNIKGEGGLQGASGFQQWIRESALTDDLLYPKDITGQENPRILVGIANDVFNKAHPLAKSTFISDGQPQIAIGHDTLHGGGSGDNLLMPTLTAASDGSLIIQGSQNGASPQIVIQTTNQNIILSAGGTSFMSYDQQPDTVGTPEHKFSGGQFNVTSPDAYSTHSFKNVSGKQITMTLNTSNYHSIKAGTLDIVFQDGNNRNVGFGTFGASTISNKISVAGNASIGSAYKNIAAALNGLIVEGQTGIGVSTVQGTSMLQVSNHISVNNGSYLLNSYTDGSYKSNIAGIGTRLRNNNSVNGFALDVAPNSISGGLAQTFQNAFTVNVDSAFVGFGTDGPTAKIHIYNEELLISNTNTGLTKGYRTRYDDNEVWVGKDLNLAPANTAVRHFIGNGPGNQPLINLTYNSTTGKQALGVKTWSPAGDMEVRGQSNYDGIIMGDFNSRTIFNISGGNGVNGTNGARAGAYVGFNASVNSNDNTVTFKQQVGQSGPVANGAGFMIFNDVYGNMHIAFCASNTVDIILPPEVVIPGF